MSLLLKAMSNPAGQVGRLLSSLRRRGVCRALAPGLAVASGALWLTAEAAIAGGLRSGEQRPPRPARTSIEYRMSWGLSAVRAYGAYARGASGRGIVVAMIDTGLAGLPGELFGQVSPRSIDLLPVRKRESPGILHGSRTAGLLAGRLDGKKTVGVAYGATLLSIRADIDGSCAEQCKVRGKDLARGIDYALANGARIIGIPLVGFERLESVEPALARAAASGAMIVAAAGNNGSDGPLWPALYAAEPRFAGSMLVAGASTIEGELASWSSKALTTRERYIAAPGQKVVVDCTRRSCKLASGTSFSVAYVAGALSLLLDAYPTLTPAEAAKILLASAADRGRRGVDQVTGAGLLDITRAMRLAKRQVEAAQAIAARPSAT